MSAATTEPQALTPEHRRKAKKATLAAAFGTFVEFYDFSVYGYVATTLAVVFFPSDDPTVGVLNTLLVFGSAFIVRPLGAIFFGRLGDKVGRRASLISSILLMTVASAVTGLLPGYAQIGVLAPILLIVLRCLQGFSAGGENGGAISFAREWASPRFRPLVISFVVTLGVLSKAAAAGVTALVASQMDQQMLQDWGWRIPFLIAIPLGLICLYLRLTVDDSPEFIEARETQNIVLRPFATIFSQWRGALAKVMAVSIIQNVGGYLGTVFIAVYFTSVLGFAPADATAIILVALVAAAACIPLVGLLGNRIGVQKVLAIACIAYVVLSIPSFLLMGAGSVPLAIGGLLLSMIPYVFVQVGSYAAIPEFFPVQVRHSGVAFGHSVGAVLGGGLSPYLATWLIEVTGDLLTPAYLLVGMGVAGAIFTLGFVRPSGKTSHSLA